MLHGNKQKEVEIHYSFHHPRSLVFKAWIDPAYLAEWFAPHGCTLTFKKLNIVEGGTFHSCIHNPEFGDCWCIGEYKEITPPEKIVFSMIIADEDGKVIDPTSIGFDPEWPGETQVTVTFEESDGITSIMLKQTVSETLAKKTGAHPSWIQMLERLEKRISLE